MKRESGIVRCGLAGCLCSENVTCNGCNSAKCPDKEQCENRKCSIYGKDYLLDCLERNDRNGSEALMAMREIQESAEKNGLSEMTLDEINAEIAEVK